MTEQEMRAAIVFWNAHPLPTIQHVGREGLPLSTEPASQGLTPTRQNLDLLDSFRKAKQFFNTRISYEDGSLHFQDLDGLDVYVDPGGAEYFTVDNIYRRHGGTQPPPSKRPPSKLHPLVQLDAAIGRDMTKGDE